MTKDVASKSLKRNTLNNSTEDSPLFPRKVAGMNNKYELEVEYSDLTYSDDIKQANHYIMIIINVIFSSLGVAYAVYYYSYAITTNIGLRVLISLLSFFVLVAIETTLYAVSFNRSALKKLKQ